MAPIRYSVGCQDGGECFHNNWNGKYGPLMMARRSRWRVFVRMLVFVMAWFRHLFPATLLLVTLFRELPNPLLLGNGASSTPQKGGVHPFIHQLVVWQRTSSIGGVVRGICVNSGTVRLPQKVPAFTTIRDGTFYFQKNMHWRSGAFIFWNWSILTKVIAAATTSFWASLWRRGRSEGGRAVIIFKGTGRGSDDVVIFSNKFGSTRAQKSCSKACKRMRIGGRRQWMKKAAAAAMTALCHLLQQIWINACAKIMLQSLQKRMRIGGRATRPWQHCHLLQRICFFSGRQKREEGWIVNSHNHRVCRYSYITEWYKIPWILTTNIPIVVYCTYLNK